MKKAKHLLISLAMVFSLTVGAKATFAAEGYGAAGCGVGAMLIGSKKGFVQVFAATSNWVMANQLTGIVFGVFNCPDSGVASNAEHEQKVFVHLNIDSLEQDMAAGHGESLNSLANVLGCPTDQYAAFGKMTQREFVKLSGLSAEPTKMLTSIKASLKADPVLAKSCGVI